MAATERAERERRVAKRLGLDGGGLAALLTVLLDGLALRCALDPGFDPAPACRLAQGLLSTGVPPAA